MQEGDPGVQGLCGQASCTAHTACLTLHAPPSFPFTPRPWLPAGTTPTLALSLGCPTSWSYRVASSQDTWLGLEFHCGEGNLPRLQLLETHPMSLIQEISFQIAQTHMQKSYQYVRICIYVNLLSLFLDIMSYLITVTSVEEESSFPLPEQNPVRGSFGEITCCRVYGRWAEPHQEPAAAATWLLLSPTTRLLPIISTMADMGRPTKLSFQTHGSPDWLKSREEEENTCWLLHLCLIINTYAFFS